MIITGSGMEEQGESERLVWKLKRVEPEISLEWKDLKIEVKYCGNDLPDEVHEFVELFPNLSDKVPSSDCIIEKKSAVKRKARDGVDGRPGSRGSNASCHTLTQVLEQNKMVNKRRSDGSSVSGIFSPEPGEELAEEEEEADDKSQKSEDLDLPDDIDQLIDVKMLITLEDGSKKCHICSKVFSDTTRMKRHLLSHSDKKPFKCHLCGWGFHQKTNMERHLASHTKPGEGHPCNYCNSWFTTKSVVSLHIRDAHQGKPATKTSRYEDDDNYSPHKTQENHVKKLTRPDTIQTIGGEDDLSNLKCNICGKTFVKKTNLKHHLMLHRGEKPWKCHICGWRFVQKCNLKKHIETHSSGIYKCPHCDIKFASKGAVSGHIDLVHSSKPGIILNADVVVNPEEDDEEIEIPAPEEPPKPKSSQSTPSNNWWNHIEENSEPENKMVAGSNTISQKPTPLNIPKVPSLPKLEQMLKTFPCKTCSKVFSSKKELDNHVLVHNAGMKPYACPVCGLRFHLIHNMKRHLQNHEESGEIELGTATGLLEAVEASATKVQSHDPDNTVTTNANGYMKCNLCKKWFSEEAALQRHMEVHSEKRPHACPICGWRFKQMHNMKRHLMTHSGAKPYSCDFCDKSYTDNYSLKQHVAKIHPDVASSLPHMMITPRNKNKPHHEPKIFDDEGFKSMVNEMTASQKAAALQAYQDSMISQNEQLPFGVEAVTYDDEEHLDMDLEMDPSDFMEEGNLEITSEDEAEIAEYANEDIGENTITESEVEAIEDIVVPDEGSVDIAEEDIIIPAETATMREVDDLAESEERPGTAELIREIEGISGKNITHNSGIAEDSNIVEEQELLTQEIVDNEMED